MYLFLILIEVHMRNQSEYMCTHKSTKLNRHIKHLKCGNECDWWSNTRIIVWFRWGQPYFPTFYYCHLPFSALLVIILKPPRFWCYITFQWVLYIFFKGWKANLMPAVLMICLVVTFLFLGLCLLIPVYQIRTVYTIYYCGQAKVLRHGLRQWK